MNIIVKKFARKFFNAIELGILLFVLVVFVLKFELVSTVFTTDVVFAGGMIFVFLLGHISGRIVEFLFPTMKKKNLAVKASGKPEQNTENFSPAFANQPKVKEVVQHTQEHSTEQSRAISTNQMFDMLNELNDDKPRPHIIKVVSDISQEEDFSDENP